MTLEFIDFKLVVILNRDLDCDWAGYLAEYLCRISGIDRISSRLSDIAKKEKMLSLILITIELGSVRISVCTSINP